MVEVGAEVGAEGGAEVAAVRSFALRELSLRVPAGTLCVIIGEVGCSPTHLGCNPTHPGCSPTHPGYSRMRLGCSPTHAGGLRQELVAPATAG